MDKIDLLLAAIATGAVSAAKDTTSQAVKDAYAGLKTLLQKRFANKPQAELALNEYEKDVEIWQKPLQKSLLEAQVDQDENILHLARHVLLLVNQQQASQGNISIHINDGQGIIGVNHGTVTQHFSN